MRDKRLRKLFVKTLCITLLIFTALIAGAYAVFTYVLKDLEREGVNESNLSVNENLQEAYIGQKVMNIALFGVDTQNESNAGRSDAIMICSVNGVTGKVKLISIARDTYVDIEGYGRTKINHAYAYGGAELAIQTLNKNFNLDITDYVTVNFNSLAVIIDEMGGVEIDVTEAERKEVNAYLLSGPRLQETGLVTLTGAQAVSYSRIRHIGGDLERGQRQREVLECLFQKALEINPLQYVSYIKKIMPLAQTSLTNEEILQAATKAISGGLVLEQAGMPNENISAQGQTIGGVWYYVYDLEQAANMIEMFLYNDVPFDQYGKEENVQAG